MDGSSYGARATEEEAERWEQLADTAEAELIDLRRPPRKFMRRLLMRASMFFDNDHSRE
jgi:hypothetical protein